MKTIMLKILGSDQKPLDIILHPGDTTRDVLAAADLTGYVLSLPWSHTYLSEEKELYGQLNDGDKLYAVMPAGELY